MKAFLLQPKYFKRALFVSAGLVLAMALVAGLKPQPERYTELYFDQPQTLPSVWPKQPVAFAFHVHNVEGEPVTYAYQVLESTAAGQQEVVKSGQLTLADGGAQDVPVVLVTKRTQVRTEVTVVLPETQQQIHFWIGA